MHLGLHTIHCMPRCGGRGGVQVCIRRATAQRHYRPVVPLVPALAVAVIYHRASAQILTVSEDLCRTSAASG